MGIGLRLLTVAHRKAQGLSLGPWEMQQPCRKCRGCEADHEEATFPCVWREVGQGGQAFPIGVASHHVSCFGLYRDSAVTVAVNVSTGKRRPWSQVPRLSAGPLTERLPGSRHWMHWGDHSLAPTSVPTVRALRAVPAALVVKTYPRHILPERWCCDTAARSMKYRSRHWQLLPDGDGPHKGLLTG